MKNAKLSKLLATASLLAALPNAAWCEPASPATGAPDALATGFREPPPGARPRVWWHWLNGNVSKEGIQADIGWMKRIGIGGLQAFDVNLDTPQVVAKRLLHMTPEWKDAFRLAAQEADRAGLELAIASSPGWSETGGPWVAPADGLKKLVWSETVVAGGRRQALRLAQPPAVAGPYQDLPMQIDVSDLIAGHDPAPGPSFYRDVRVLAIRSDATSPLPTARLSDGAGHALTALRDATGAYRDVVLGSVFGPQRPELRMDFGSVVTVRSATLHIPGGAVAMIGPLLAPTLEASPDGVNWRKIADFTLSDVPVTLAFAPVSARYFRVQVTPRAGSPEDPAAVEAKQNLAMADVFGQGIGRLLGRPVTIGTLRLESGVRPDRFEVKAGFDVARDYFALPAIADGATGPSSAETIDLTDRMTPDGSLDWTPPAGTWKILRFGYSLLGKTNHPAPAEATGLEVDKYDRDAVRRYLEHYLGNYRDAVGPDLLGGRGVQALLTDSIEIGAANWTPRLLEQFRQRRGYDPLPWLPVLAGNLVGSRADSDRFLFDYRRTLSDLMASEHYGTIAAVAHRNGLKVYGESLEGNRTTLGDDMAMRRYADVPMAAMWAFDPRKGPQPSYVADVRGAASVAHIYGRNVVAAESMTATLAPWAFGPADLKPIVDLEFALGVNLPVIHTSAHVPVEDRKPGLSLGGIGQFFNRNESWAELARPWVDYLARNAFLLQQGRNVADLAYFYGEEAPVSGLFGHQPITDVPQGYGFDFVNFDALAGALANDGADVVSAGGARYRAIYLGGSSRFLSLPALRRLNELARGGATIIGLAPTAPPGLRDDPAEYARLVQGLWPGGARTAVGQGQVMASTDLAAVLAELGLAPDFHAEGSGGEDIAFAHRRWADGEDYFLVNRQARAVAVAAHFRVTGLVPELWHAETGQSEPVAFRTEAGQTVIDLRLAAQDAVHVVFRKGGAKQPAPRQAEPLTARPIEGPWQVRFEPGRGAPAETTMKPLSALDRHPDPGIRYFSGLATYRTTFATPPGWRPGRPLTLDLGEAREVAEVKINGQLAGYAWHAPYTVDIAGLARKGRHNTLEVRVANLWVNRLIRDADPAVTDKVTWTSTPTYRPDAKLRPSGLIGPVMLIAPGR